MTKKELIGDLAEARKMRPRDARAVVEALLHSIERALSDGQSVTLRGFGRFDVQSRSGRIVKAPGKGGEIRVPARLVPSFHCAPGLGRRIAGPGTLGGTGGKASTGSRRRHGA
jgi:DNA-binding protein HU-beta